MALRCRRSTGQFIDFGNQGRDTAEKRAAWGALIEFDVRSGQTLVHDLHDLGDNIMGLRILYCEVSSIHWYFEWSNLHEDRRS